MTTHPLDPAALAAYIAEHAERLQVPGLAVGVLVDGVETYVCHGVTSVDNPLPVDAATLFSIGSTTKVYTATAIMALVERGALDLAAPVRRYLPDFQVRDERVAAEVTLLELLNHTAGWSGDVFTDTGYGDDALERYVERFADTAQETPLGEYVSYNNASFIIAGRVIEAVTGQPYEAAMRQLVLDPLDLHEHFFFPWEVMVRRFVVGHTLEEDGLQVAPWHEPRSSHPAGGEFAASVRDQIRFARFHLGDGAGILRPDTLARMRQPTTMIARGGDWDAFGVSWQLREIDGVQIAAHGGSGAGYQTALELVPAHGFALSILTNAAHAGQLISAVTAWVFEHCLGMVERVPEPLPLGEADLAAYAGTYRAHSAALQVSVEGDHLLGAIVPNQEVVEALLGEGAEFTPPPPMPFRILPADQFIVTAGQAQGMRGPLMRDASGRVTALNFGGRIMLREG